MISCKICGSTKGPFIKLAPLDDFELPVEEDGRLTDWSGYACRTHTNKMPMMTRKYLRAFEKRVRKAMRKADKILAAVREGDPF